MYLNEAITGKSLPDHTLCLTFDDGPGMTSEPGPGPRTLDVARYLHDQNIKGTFFMTGKYASDLPDILQEVANLGHLVANHTYDHPNMVDYLAASGDVIAQIIRTDALVRNWVDAPVIFFRAPYLTWSSDVAKTLNSNMTALLSHIGPIGCDIDAGDWEFWQNAKPPADCANAYSDKIQEIGKGIVLMHDSTSDMDVVRRRNRAYEFLGILIPKLKQQDFQFVRVDQIPDVVTEIGRPLTCALKASNGRYVSPQGGGGGQIIVNGPAIGPWEPIEVEDLYVGKVALRSVNGLYISPQNGGGGEVIANGPMVGEWEPLDLISIGANRVAFRTITGHFLTREKQDGGRLMANVNWMREWEIFSFEMI